MVAHRLGRPYRHYPPGIKPKPDRLERKIMLDYSGPELAGARLTPDDVAVTLSHGVVHGVRIERSVDDKEGRRVIFDVFSTEAEPCEAIVKLAVDGKPVAETVVLRFSPQEGLLPV